MLKNSASGIHAGYCRLTVRAASTDVPHHIRRGTNLKSSTYPRGWAGEISSIFEHPEVI
jgi:hypothetical protein